jgi:Icc-related predicted phosphoesterase
MRLLCTSDIHYRLPQLDWLVAQAATDDVDVVVMPGDHLQVVGAAPLAAQVVVVSKYLDRIATSAVLLASSGNHDLDGPGTDGEQTASWLQRVRADGVHVDGDSVDLDGVRFTVCPWWDGPLGRDRVEAQLAAAAAHRPERWIWVYHSPPAGTRLCRAGLRDYPDPEAAAWIERWQPDIVVSGHIHQAPWVDGGGWYDRLGRTWVFNAGHQPGPVPAHVIIDLAAGAAEWVALPEHERVELSFSPGDLGRASDQ